MKEGLAGMNLTPFQVEGNWYKGNLHAHSVFSSDGVLPPEEIVRIYRENGYSFLAITDHNIYIDHTHLNTDDFITLPGVEVTTSNIYENKPPVGMHTLAIAKKLPAGFNNFQRFPTDAHESICSIQEYLDYLIGKGMLLILPHPVWAGFELEDYVSLKGFIGIEIFNSGSEADGGRGSSVLQWDSLLRRNIRMLGFGTDDAHLYDLKGYSWGGCYIVLKAPSLKHEAITDAIEKGLFYTSQGPEIHDFFFDEDTRTLYVKCSPVKQIRFLTYERKGRVIYALKEETITEGCFTLRQDGVYNYARVEVIDQNGKVAYTNPIFFRDSYDRPRLL
jgi:hypothetical protein